MIISDVSARDVYDLIAGLREIDRQEARALSGPRSITDMVTRSVDESHMAGVTIPPTKHTSSSESTKCAPITTHELPPDAEPCSGCT